VLEKLLVGLLVAVAAGYAAWALAPRALRGRLASRLHAWTDGWSRCPQWLRSRLAAAADRSAVSGCDACGSGSGRAATHGHITRKNP
jgi:hypothetical protein